VPPVSLVRSGADFITISGQVINITKIFGSLDCSNRVVFVILLMSDGLVCASTLSVYSMTMNNRNMLVGI
jgi:hypothetical protein